VKTGAQQRGWTTEAPSGLSEAVVWSQEAFGMPFRDNWWQTGGIMIANFPAMDVKPGSMGRPLPGIEAEIVHQTDQGEIEIVENPDSQGELALRPGWPSMFRSYLGDDDRSRRRFTPRPAADAGSRSQAASVLPGLRGSS
jgi:acyl-coenzyme A synthetase/AMP-(fatty) acid ligase